MEKKEKELNTAGIEASEDSKHLYQILIQIMLGQKSGETFFARNSLAAREIIKMRPDFSYLFNSPKKIGQV